MMKSLFSEFNPSSILSIQLMWISIFTAIPLPANLWKAPSKSALMLTILIKKILTQFSQMSTKPQLINMSSILPLFISITLMNLISLFPFSFASTSQPQVVVSLALPLWMSTLLIKVKHPRKTLSHMVPNSTPYILIPLMVMIETVSLFIQPITLSVRLMANITAGHILMALISSAYKSIQHSPVLIIHIMFMVLEMAVSIIQAYVFTMLLSMYMKP